MTPDHAASLVVDLVLGRPVRPLLIALDGPSAAGTTTLAEALARPLDAAVVGVDDFYRDLPDDERWALDAAQGLAQYFDWQRLRREALEPLTAGRPARYRPYSWRPEGGLAAHHVEIAAQPIIIVEGVYAARPEVADLVDLAVLVETPAPERERRLVERGHGNDVWWPRWGAAEDLYYTQVSPPSRYDLVVPGI